MLRCYTEESYDWEENLPLVLFTYRTTKHATTGISPFQIMFGRDPTSMTHLEPLGGYEPSALASRGGGRRGNYPGARAPMGPENSVCKGMVARAFMAVLSRQGKGKVKTYNWEE